MLEANLTERRLRLFLLYADEHLFEEETLELLPSVTIFADANVTVQTQFTEPAQSTQRSRVATRGAPKLTW